MSITLFKQGVIIALGVNDAQNESASSKQIVADLQWYSTYTRAYAADSENDMASGGSVWYIAPAIAPVQRYKKPFASKLQCINEKLCATHTTISNPLDDNGDYAPEMASIFHSTGISEWRRQCMMQ